jgi:hypothetical protein
MSERATPDGLPDPDETGGSIDDSPSRGTGTPTDERKVTVRHVPPDAEGQRAAQYSAQGAGAPDDEGLPTVTAASPAASAPEGDLGPVAPGP